MKQLIKLPKRHKLRKTLNKGKANRNKKGGNMPYVRVWVHGYWKIINRRRVWVNPHWKKVYVS